jgi:hypothetical protein
MNSQIDNFMNNLQQTPGILQIAKDFIKAVEKRKSFDEIARFYHPDVIQIEYPNSVTKNIKIRTLLDLEKAAEQGRRVVREEHYEIMNSYACNNTVIVEVIWKATSAIEIGAAPAGSQIQAYFAQFFEFKDGKIFRQRNYDCFENLNKSPYKNSNEKVFNYDPNN